MRKIKFRAWNRKLKTMQAVDELNHLNSWSEKGMIGVNGDGFTIGIQGGDHNDCFIMQYTGLKDMSGKEIYEGDIVTWSDGDWEGKSNPRIAKVEFTPELSFFAINVGDHGHKFGFSDFIYTDTEKHLKVIGNVYETDFTK